MTALTEMRLVRGWQKDREYNALWTTDEPMDDGTRGVLLTAWHNQHHKAYEVKAYEVTVTDDGSYVMDIALFGDGNHKKARRLQVEPTARYSAKRLKELWDSALFAFVPEAFLLD